VRENIIRIEWEGPLTVEKVIKKMKNGGIKENNYAGPDYGLYQIYGWHPIHKDNTLLYVGKAQEQTFSERFKQHNSKEGLLGDEKYKNKIKVRLGRLKDSKYLKDNSWRLWNMDINIAESILIHKYSPNYNSSGLWERPNLTPYKRVQLKHLENRGELCAKDNAPEDYRKR